MAREYLRGEREEADVAVVAREEQRHATRRGTPTHCFEVGIWWNRGGHIRKSFCEICESIGRKGIGFTHKLVLI